MSTYSTGLFACERRSVAPDRQRVVAVGEIDLGAGPRLTRVLRKAQEQAQHVVLDLEGTTFIDTGGIRILLAATAHAHARAGTFEIVHPTAPVMRLIELVGANLALKE